MRGACRNPSRTAILTGLSPVTSGVYSNRQSWKELLPDVVTLPQYFGRRGYTTKGGGKIFHHGKTGSDREDAPSFEEFFKLRIHSGKPDVNYNGYVRGRDAKQLASPSWDWGVHDVAKQTDEYTVEYVTQVMEQESRDKPLFLAAGIFRPHLPFWAPPESFSRYPFHDVKLPPRPAGDLDDVPPIGVKLSRTESFIFDNGTQSKQAQTIFNAGMRDRKTSVFEGGHRVPCFVRWPAGGLQHGSDLDELTEVQDLLPTLIELCGLGQENATFDGISLAGLLTGAETELPDRKLVVQYRVSGEPWDPAVVMWDKWRLINRDQLYHVGRDPGQIENVADQHPDVAQKMAEHYESWHKEAKPLFDLPRWITIGSEQANPLTLYAQDWTGGYCDNRSGLTRATAQGYWNVIVDREGIYELQLRRWPRESGKSLTEGINGPGDTGFSARPIAAANLQIAGQNYTLDTAVEDRHITFCVKLPVGKTQLATTLMDAKDQALCSAIYVYVERVSKDEATDSTMTPPTTRKPKQAAPTRKRKAAKPKAPKAADVSVAASDSRRMAFQNETDGTARGFDKFGGVLG